MATSMINNNSMDLLHDSGTINLSHGTAYDTGIAFSDVVGKYKELSIQVNKNGSQAYIVRVPVFSNLLEFLYTHDFVAIFNGIQLAVATVIDSDCDVICQSIEIS